MRIAIANWSNKLEGGAEQYIASIGAKLLARGHDVAIWHEVSLPQNRAQILGSHGISMWDESVLGRTQALGEIRRWRPDVIYCQGLTDPGAEAELQNVAPSVYFAHNHNGTCISGEKTTRFPVVRPCNRTFGPTCLLNFFPRRCGGRSPLTMLRDYSSNARRLSVLATYTKVITHSAYVRQNLMQNGITCESVRFFVEPRVVAGDDEWKRGPAWRLLMIGRMTNVKGGELLLRALPQIVREISEPLIVTIAGDGPCRAQWEAGAKRLQRDQKNLEFRFPGWLTGDDRDSAYKDSDLLLFPSVWPEPFGMVGLEAGQYGVPTVAFAVGGIPDWLTDGENGFLASGDPPSATGYARAVIRALRQGDESYGSLRDGARRSAAVATIEAHYEDLIRVFEQAVERGSRIEVNCNA